MDNDTVTVSKFLSYVLRHRPDAIGLQLDAEGWADVGELVRLAGRSGKVFSRETIEKAVRTNDKKRFALSPDGSRIRAVQGHSVSGVDLEYPPLTPPETLWHGTADRFLASIRQQGLLPKSRQYVHLSGDPETAAAVGQRHGRPAVLRIEAGKLHARGHIFHQADNGVWLTRAVPAEAIVWPDA